MELKSNIDLKRIYRVTGTPENYLTALRYSVWGFNNENDWKKQEPGDIIFFHSQIKSKFVAKSKLSAKIVGFGVVGNNFYIDQTPLWIDEYLDNRSYPYRFSFSEIYLFSNIPINDEWDSTNLTKIESTKMLIAKLLNNGIPLGELTGFPPMGSYSTIKNYSVKFTLLNEDRLLYPYLNTSEDTIYSKSTELIEASKAESSLRNSTSLLIFGDIQKKIFKGDYSGWYQKSIESLQKAEETHYSLIKFLSDYFEKRNYRLFFNNHVDLFAHNENNSVLIEAKSVENKNFRAQSKKAIVQLFEYNYFEIANYKNKHNLTFTNEHKMITLSQTTTDSNYIEFINSLDIIATYVQDEGMNSIGNPIPPHLL